MARRRGIHESWNSATKMSGLNAASQQTNLEMPPDGVSPSQENGEASRQPMEPTLQCKSDRKVNKVDTAADETSKKRGRPPKRRYRVSNPTPGATSGPTSNSHLAPESELHPKPVARESTSLPISLSDNHNETSLSKLTPPNSNQDIVPSQVDRTSLKGKGPATTRGKRAISSSKANEDVAHSQVDRRSLKNTRSTVNKGKRASLSKKMSDSDSSDVIVLKNFRTNRSGNTPQDIPAPSAQRNRRRSSRWSERGISSDQTTSTDERDKRRPTAEANTRRNSAGVGPSQPKTPVKGKNQAYKVAPPEALEELKRLQQEVVLQAHLNRFKDEYLPGADPNFLARIREGPGLDPNSEVYQEIEKRRQTPGVSAIKPAASAQNTFPAVGDSDEEVASESGQLVFEEPVKKPGSERYKAQWTLYTDSPRAYPKVENGKIVLSPEPTPGHEYVPMPPEDPGLKPFPEPRANNSQVAPENNTWGDAFYADWEYRPRACSSYEAFRDTFRRWLDSTIGICYKVDLYHQGFFDGTAHSDGERSLFFPDIETPVVVLDMEIEENRLHAHETVAGYCHNLHLHMKKDEEAEEIKKKAVRDAYLQAVKTMPQPSPKAPRANVYLRPVENGDIPELVELFNWYIKNSTLNVEIDLVDAGDVRQRIEDCKRERLPFLVAAERRTGLAARNPEYSHERIFGYALANDFTGQRSSGRFTAELELFVKQDEKCRGIGRSLMDKLLEVCDASYNPRKGYFFDSNLEDRPGYYAGGRRRLARLVFVYSYPKDESAECERVKRWLQKYQFEEQGLLKGTRVKFQKFLNVSYLVREVGPSDEGLFTR